MKLRDDSLKAIGHVSDGLGGIWSGGDKWRFPMPTPIPEGEEFPFLAIYLLKPSDQIVPLRIDSLNQSGAVAEVLRQVYSAKTLTGSRAIRALDAAARIAETVPVRTIAYHRSFENLPAIREAILRDVEGLTNA